MNLVLRVGIWLQRRTWRWRAWRARWRRSNLHPSRTWSSRRRIGFTTSFGSSSTPFGLGFTWATSFARRLAWALEARGKLGRSSAFTTIRGDTGRRSGLDCARFVVCRIQGPFAHIGIYRAWSPRIWTRHLDRRRRHSGLLTWGLRQHVVERNPARVERAA